MGRSWTNWFRFRRKKGFVPLSYSFRSMNLTLVRNIISTNPSTESYFICAYCIILMNRHSFYFTATADTHYEYKPYKPHNLQWTAYYLLPTHLLYKWIGITMFDPNSCLNYYHSSDINTWCCFMFLSRNLSTSIYSHPIYIPEKLVWKNDDITTVFSLLKKWCVSEESVKYRKTDCEIFLRPYINKKFTSFYFLNIFIRYFRDYPKTRVQHILY